MSVTKMQSFGALASLRFCYSNFFCWCVTTNNAEKGKSDKHFPALGSTCKVKRHEIHDDHDLKRRPFLGPFNIMRNLHTHDKLDFDVAKQIVIFAPLAALQLHFQDGTVTHLGLNTNFFISFFSKYS